MIIVRKKLPGVDQNSLVHFLNQACRAAGLRRDVNVLITSRRAIRDLNRRFRGKDKATDVLSFPAAGKSGDLAGDIAIWVVVIVATLSAADYFVKFSRRLGVVGGRVVPPGGSLG